MKKNRKMDIGLVETCRFVVVLQVRTGTLKWL
jgi:hypothetical protein